MVEIKVVDVAMIGCSNLLISFKNIELMLISQCWNHGVKDHYGKTKFRGVLLRFLWNVETALLRPGYWNNHVKPKIRKHEFEAEYVQFAETEMLRWEYRDNTVKKVVLPVGPLVSDHDVEIMMLNFVLVLYSIHHKSSTESWTRSILR